MELKYVKYDSDKKKVTSSNRTFMELKSVWTYHPPTPGGSSNRTFMELKSHQPLKATLQVYSSNRTFMELKLF